MTASDAVNATNWSLIVFSAVMVGGRLYTRLSALSYQTKVVDYLADALIILAWLSFVSLGLTTHLLSNTGFFDDFDPDNATSYQIELNYVIDVMVWPCLYFVKFAMLCFFDRLITRSLFPELSMAIKVIAGICAVCFLYTEGTTIFWCWPISLNWNLDSDCETRSNIKVDRSTWGLHMGTDFLIYALGITFLKEVSHLPLREKIGAASMFALGFVGIIVSALAYWLPNNYENVWIYRAVEQATLIVIACIPSLRSLVNRKVTQRRNKTFNSTNSLSSYYTPSGTYKSRSESKGSIQNQPAMPVGAHCRTESFV